MIAVIFFYSVITSVIIVLLVMYFNDLINKWGE